MTQTTELLTYFKATSKQITPLEALNQFGIFRLADVVYKLKNKGHNIKTHLITQNKKTFASYEYISN